MFIVHTSAWGRGSCTRQAHGARWSVATARFTRTHNDDLRAIAGGHERVDNDFGDAVVVRRIHGDGRKAL
jgi:hypothetical protein